MNFFEPYIPSGILALVFCIHWHASYSDTVLDTLMFRELRTWRDRLGCAGTWVVHVLAAMTLVWTAWRLAQ